MKILHFNHDAMIGGAGIGTYRLHQGLLNQGIDSRLLVGRVKSDSDRVAVAPRKPRIEGILELFTRRLGLNSLNLVSSFKIPNHPFYQQADVLNFHNLHSGYFNYLAIPTLTKNKPAVFTLHDMWSFTGHCAYTYDCLRWKTGCGKCPYPKTDPAIAKDNTRLEWKLKNWVYNRSDLTIVTPSKWLKKKAQQSMLGRFPIHHIPYGIDTKAYEPLDPEMGRRVLGIAPGKKVIMFGAQSLKQSRKGEDLLLKAISSLPSSLKRETVLLTMGEGGEKIEEATEMVTVNLGYISSDRLKSVAYSAADLFLLPTRADNSPLVLLESFACGTPVVSFNVGGVPDLVCPGVTGYLAQPEDAEDFSHGILELLEDDNLRESMGKKGRAIILEEYPLQLQAKRYIELYKQLLS